MHRLSPVLASWVAASWVIPAVVAAQTEGNITIFRDGEQVSNAMNVLYVNGSDCGDPPAEFKFRLRLQSQSNNLRNRILQVWTSNSGEDCRSISGRKDPDGSNCDEAPCRLREAGTKTITNPSEDLEVELPATELFSGDGEEMCQQGGTMKVTFVAVNAPGCASPSENLFSDPYSATFELRTDSPPIPDNVKAADGDRSIGIRWDDAGGEARNEYTVYFDTDPGDRCGNTVLENMMPASDADDLDVESRVTSSASMNFRTDEYDIGINGYVAAAISTEDIAGNRSDLSRVVCGRRIVTQSIVDSVENDRGESIKTCSSTGRPSSGSAVPVTWLLLLAFAGWRCARGSRA